jgi:flagellar FliL protein
MSAAAAPDAGDAPKKKGSKKLIIIIVAVVLLLAVAGGAAVFLMKKKAAEAEEADGAEGGGGHAKAKTEEVAHKVHKREPGHPPVYVALDPFTVNLADRDQERYAQIGITLEVDEQKFADEMKGYMPAIRNSVLLILSHKTANELLALEGKEKLAEEIMRESVRPMGIEIDPEEEDAGSKKKRRRQPVYNPVQHVHFSSFIIQ